MAAREAMCTFRHQGGVLELDVYVQNLEILSCPISRHIDRNAIDNACIRYLEAIDEICLELYRAAGANKLAEMFEKVVCESSKLCSDVLGEDMAERLWSLSRSVNDLAVRTELFDVPWEAMYYGDFESGSFLSDNCTVWRRPLYRHAHTGCLNVLEERSSVGRGIGDREILAVDAVLAYGCNVNDRGVVRHTDGNAVAAEGQKLIDYVNSLAPAHGVYVTTGVKAEMVRKFREVRLTKWLCHCGTQGLRLSDKIFYDSEDARLHPFMPHNIICLVACNAGAQRGKFHNIAKAIFWHSRCTIIASLAIVEGSAGLAFLDKVSFKGGGGEGGRELSAVWRAIRAPDWRREPTLAKCISLWFGVYGWQHMGMES